jgi:hypothetical protein
MAKNQALKDKLNVGMYNNPKLEKKILHIKRSLDEVNEVLGKIKKRK